MLERLKSVAEELGRWSWPLKFLLGAVIGAFAGGGVLTFLLEHSAYSYALTYGFRPPVEGTPYLRALVSFGSVSLLLIAAAISTSVMLLVDRLLLRMVNRDLAKETARFRAMPVWKAAPILLAFSAALSAFQLLPAVLREKPPEPVCVWPLIYCGPVPGLNWEYFVQVVAIGLVICTMLWRPSLVWWGTGALVLLYYAWVSMNVLPPEGYARLLRNTGYGGGIPVRLELTNHREPETREEVDGFLLLRSTTSVIVYDRDRRRITEYPFARVLRLSHPDGGLHALPYALPPASPLRAARGG